MDQLWHRLGGALTCMTAARHGQGPELEPPYSAQPGDDPFPIWVLTDGFSIRYLHLHAKSGATGTAYTKFLPYRQVIPLDVGPDVVD